MTLVMRDRIRSGLVNHVSRTCAYSLTRQSTRNPPNSPKEIGSSHVMSIMHLKIFDFSSHQVSSRSLHSKRFPRFPVSKISVSPLHQPPSSPVPPDLIRIENGESET